MGIVALSSFGVQIAPLEECAGIQFVFAEYKKNVLDFFGGQRGLINCKIVFDILEGPKRQGWGSTDGDPEAATTKKSKSSTQPAAKATESSSTNDKKSSTNNRKATHKTEKTKQQ